jgi:hypothetical protein
VGGGGGGGGIGGRWPEGSGDAALGSAPDPLRMGACAWFV